MDHKFETKELARSLSFEVEAVPQDNSIQLTSSTNNNNPLSVKIKVRKKKDIDSPQNAVLSIPKFTKRGSKPERIRLASSDQTIISFNVFMEEADEKKVHQKTKKKFFGLFKSGRGYDSDSSSRSKSENEMVKDNFSKIGTIINETKTSRKDRGKGIFGKSKPGGCLDPPFGEDKYAYEAVENMQSTSAPYQTQEVKLKEKDSLSKKTDSINKLKLIEKKTSLEDGTFDDKTCKTEKSSVLSLFQADSFKPPVEISYSNSIITYPPPLTSSEMRVFNAVNEKNLKNKSSIDRSSFQDPTDRYFGPKRDSGSRKSSKIEGIKEGDKNFLSAPEQSKYLRTFDENILETKEPSFKDKEDYLKNKIIKDATRPVAGGLIASTLLQSPSREKLEQDTVKLEPTENKDKSTKIFFKGPMLPVPGGLIAPTQQKPHSRDNLNQDRIINPENAEVTNPKRDSANVSKEIPTVEREPPVKKDHFTNEIVKDSMLLVSGGLIAATLPQAFRKEKLKKDKIIDPGNAQVLEPNKDSENKEIPKFEQEPPEKKDHFTNDILKDSMLPVSGGLIAATQPQAFIKEKLKQDSIIDPKTAQVPDPNKVSAKESKQIPKAEQEPPEKKDHFTNDILKDSMLPVTGGLIAATLPQAFGKEKPKQDKIIDPENAQVPDPNKDSAKESKKIPKAEQEPSEKKDHFSNEILKHSPVTGDLIALTPPPSLSKEKLKQDKTIDSENVNITDPNKDGANETNKIPMVEQAPPEKKDNFTNEILKDSMLPDAGDLIVSTPPEALSKEKHKQELIIDPESSQIPDPNKDSTNINKEIPKVEHEPLKKKDHLTHTILKDSTLPVAGGLIALTLPQASSKEKLKKDRIIDSENGKISDLNKDGANGTKEKPKVVKELPDKKDNITNKILKDSMLPVAAGLIASTLPQAFSKEKFKQDKIIDSKNDQVPDLNEYIANDNEKVPKDLTALPIMPIHGKEKPQREIKDTEIDQFSDTNEAIANEKQKIPKLEKESFEKMDYSKNDVLEHKIIPVAEDLIVSPLLKSKNVEKVKEENVIRPENAHVGTDKSDAKNFDEKQKVEQESLEKLPVDVQRQMKSDKMPIEKTTSNVLTKLPLVKSTTTDKLQVQHRKSLNERSNLLLVENSIGSNKEIEEAILEPDLTRHEDNILISGSTEKENNEFQKTGAPYLLEKEVTLKDDTFIIDEQLNINKTLDADAVDAEIYKDVEPVTLKETKVLVKEKDREPILETDLEVDNATEKYQSKKKDPFLKDETKSPKAIVIQEQHTKRDSGFEGLIPVKNILRTSPDEEADETKPDTIKDTPSVQAVSKKDLKIVGADKEFQNYIKSRDENQEGVAENKGQQYIANIQSQSKEKLIIKEQKERVQSEPLVDTQFNASDLLKRLSLNKDLQNEIPDQDIQKRAKLEPRDKSLSLFDHRSIAHKPVQFLSPKEKYVYASPENIKKENIDNEINPEFMNQENKVIVLNIAFQSYVNKENKRVFRSVDASKPLERFNDDRIFSFKSVIEPDGVDIRVPVDPDNDLSLSIIKKGNSASESKKIFKITPEIYADIISPSKKSKSEVPSKLTEEINRDNYEAKSDTVQYKLQKGLHSPESTFVSSLENLDQQLESKLVTGHEKQVQRQESTLVTDGEQTADHGPEAKMVKSLQKSDQQPELTLTTGRVKQDQHQFKIHTDHRKSDQQPEPKFVTSWENQDHQPEFQINTSLTQSDQQPESKFVTSWKKQDQPLEITSVTYGKKTDKQLFASREKLGIEPDSSIRETDMYSLRHSLSAVYEEHLVPLQDLIKSLKQEIDSLASQQELLRHNLLGVTKLKSMRVHATKKCICQRKL